ncbi:uncharacterized protein G2W53_021717 [Senna tora]|uniref:Tify domain-containing protein n=1 Tax=Senna tora TaxID=362788 RepID=A0A834TK05_9FABA|nr:uncharacterized protein G2W53_021717 [Senna tora]
MAIYGPNSLSIVHVYVDNKRNRELCSNQAHPIFVPSPRKDRVLFGHRSKTSPLVAFSLRERSSFTGAAASPGASQYTHTCLRKTVWLRFLDNLDGADHIISRTWGASVLLFFGGNSFQNKGFWTVKGTGHINDRETKFDNPSKIEPKRPHQWFVDAAEVDFFPNKKQAVQDANGKSGSGISNVTWENNSTFNSVPNQFIGRLFGSESRPANFSEKDSYVVADDSNVRAKMISNQYREDASFGLSISPVEDTEACLSFGGIKKVKVSQVKDSDGVQAPAGQGFNRQNNSDLHQAYSGEVETGPVPIGQAFDKDSNVTLMGLNYNRVDANARSLSGAYGKGHDNIVSIDNSYNKEDTNIISFGGFPNEQDIIPVGRPTGDYGPFYNQSSVQVSTTAHVKELDASDSNAVVNTPQVDKLKPEPMSKNKQEFKAAKKEAPNSFPTNVRSLISTGMLDGVPVKYVSVAREELRGIIKGSGYLCGCQSCNYSKVLNAYEFERHAGCKTKHPNNHIYFENGKTIYQIVQELRSTPESLLFDTIQTVFGAPINQKAFRNWKDSWIVMENGAFFFYGDQGRDWLASILDWLSRERKSNTSVLESVSASLCFISLAIEKKTSSTFRFVFALCNRRTFSAFITQFKELTPSKACSTYSFKEFNPVLIGQCLTLGGVVYDLELLKLLRVWWAAKVRTACLFSVAMRMLASLPN